MTASPSSLFAIRFEDVVDAHSTIRGIVRETPVMTCGTLDRLASRGTFEDSSSRDGNGRGSHEESSNRIRLFFKCENLQTTGAFKYRGATNAVRHLTPEERARGVVTHSSGNHAGSLAKAAQLLGIDAHIVMPSNSLQAKKDAVREYGGKIYECAPNLAARETTCKLVQETTGASFIHPYENRYVMAGQGTLMLEMIDQVQREYSTSMDAVIVPVGGGGMISGCIMAAKGAQPGLKIIAAEPVGADDCSRSFHGKQFVPQTDPNTIADGLRTSMGETSTWPIIRDHVADVITVTEDEIKNSMRLVFERMKLVVEPSSAVGVAAALKIGRLFSAFKNVGVVLCGGNADLDQLPWK